MTHSIKILFFGQLKEVTKMGEMIVQASDSASAEKAVLTQFPALSTKKYFLALDKKMLSETVNLTAGQTLAFMPPFSGG